MVESDTGRILGYNYVAKAEIGNSTISFDTKNVLYSKLRPYLNKVVLPMQSGYATSEMVPLRPDTSIITREYLTYYLRSPQFVAFINSKTSGAKMPRANLAELKKHEVLCPSISEQNKITEVLDEITTAKDICIRGQGALDLLIKTRFVEMFGDPISNTKNLPKKRFDEICENLDYRRKPITASERKTGVYPYYGASGIVDHVADYIFNEDILLVSEDGANLLMRSTPIAFSVSGKVWVNNHAHVVRFEKMNMQKYIEVYFSLIDISDQITGSAQPKLNQAKLNAMQFGIPEDSELDVFLDFIKQVDKSRDGFQNILDKLNALQTSLMQEYFG